MSLSFTRGRRAVSPAILQPLLWVRAWVFPWSWRRPGFHFARTDPSSIERRRRHEKARGSRGRSGGRSAGLPARRGGFGSSSSICPGPARTRASRRRSASPRSPSTTAARASRAAPIWGGLVPYGEVWRTGANENTTITFGTPVKIEGTELPAGTYGLQTIPTAGRVDRHLQQGRRLWGAFDYKQENDALRIQVKPRPARRAGGADALHLRRRHRQRGRGRARLGEAGGPLHASRSIRRSWPPRPPARRSAGRPRTRRPTGASRTTPAWTTPAAGSTPRSRSRPPSPTSGPRRRCSPRRTTSRAR